MYFPITPSSRLQNSHGLRHWKLSPNKRLAASYLLDSLTFSTLTVSGVYLNGLSPISKKKAGIRLAMVRPQPRDWEIDCGVLFEDT